MISICVDCKKVSQRIQTTERAFRSRGFRYVNEHGGYWKGATCPDCAVVFDGDALTSRLCRECKKPLPSSRYFAHSDCDNQHKYEMRGNSVWVPEDWGCGVVDGVRF